MSAWLRGALALLWLQALAGPGASASELPLRMAAPTNLTEPLARFEGGELRGGLLKDLGDALAQQLQRRPVYLSLPAKRVSEALRDGRAQLVCYVMPGWIDGDLGWTPPVIPNAEVLAARADAPRIGTVEALAGERVGTVLGYRYPHLLAAGQTKLPFVREDAPDSRANLNKLAAGRVRYAVVDALALRDFQRRFPDKGLRLELQLSRYLAQCALALGQDLSLVELNRAIATLQQSGRLARVLAPYID